MHNNKGLLNTMHSICVYFEFIFWIYDGNTESLTLQNFKCTPWTWTTHCWHLLLIKIVFHKKLFVPSLVLLYVAQCSLIIKNTIHRSRLMISTRTFWHVRLLHPSEQKPLNSRVNDIYVICSMLYVYCIKPVNFIVIISFRLHNMALTRSHRIYSHQIFHASKRYLMWKYRRKWKS